MSGYGLVFDLQCQRHVVSSILHHLCREKGGVVMNVVKSRMVMRMMSCILFTQWAKITVTIERKEWFERSAWMIDKSSEIIYG
jgi:hypothetical protein